MMRLTLAFVLSGSFAIPRIAPAQASNGQRTIEFPVRQGVCGDGANVLYADRKRYTWPTTELTGDFHTRKCADGRAMLVVTASTARLIVGGPSLTPHDNMSGSAARDYFLQLARTLPGGTAPQAVAAAAVTDAPPSIEQLAGFARDSRITIEARSAALGWIPQLYRTSAPGVLTQFVHDTALPWQLRERALQGVWESGESGTALLLGLATSRQPERLRARTLGWLGQTPGDSAEAVLRAIALDPAESTELRSVAVHTLTERRKKRHQ